MEFSFSIFMASRDSVNCSSRLRNLKQKGAKTWSDCSNQLHVPTRRLFLIAWAIAFRSADPNLNGNRENWQQPKATRHKFLWPSQHLSDDGMKTLRQRRSQIICKLSQTTFEVFADGSDEHQKEKLHASQDQGLVKAIQVSDKIGSWAAFRKSNSSRLLCLLLLFSWMQKNVFFLAFVYRERESSRHDSTLKRKWNLWLQLLHFKCRFYSELWLLAINGELLPICKHSPNQPPKRHARHLRLYLLLIASDIKFPLSLTSSRLRLNAFKPVWRGIARGVSREQLRRL